ncbi:hypothetical protein PBAL39_23197 [Pedobacter sp. BAL39]|nr:hypothetical protein PBAL39_23197 [Pedobacter sp. BAL39]
MDDQLITGYLIGALLKSLILAIASQEKSNW